MRSKIARSHQGKGKKKSGKGSKNMVAKTIYKWIKQSNSAKIVYFITIGGLMLGDYLQDGMIDASLLGGVQLQ